MNDTIPKEIEDNAIELLSLLDQTHDVIFKHLRNLIDKKQTNLARSYITALTVDMLGKLLTFPEENKKKLADHVSAWVKHRFNLDVKIQVNE